MNAPSHPLKEKALKKALKKLKPGERPLWEFWEEFLKRYSRLDRSMATIVNVRDAIRWAVVHLDVVSIEDCFDVMKLEDKFHEYKERRQIQHSTLNSYRKNLNTYFRWLERYGFIEENTIRKIPKGKETCKEKHILTDEKIAKIIYQLSIQRSTSFERSRNILTIQLLRILGARPKEIMAIRKADISKLGDSYKIIIRGIKQGGKIRSYRMKGVLKDAYENYMQHRPANRDHEPWLLLSRKHGKAFGQKGLRYLFKHLSKTLGFRITAYGFRRYVATTLRKEGLPMDKISSHLGHASERTTRCYIEDMVEWTDEGVDLLT